MAEPVYYRCGFSRTIPESYYRTDPKSYYLNDHRLFINGSEELCNFAAGVLGPSMDVVIVPDGHGGPKKVEFNGRTYFIIPVSYEDGLDDQWLTGFAQFIKDHAEELKSSPPDELQVTSGGDGRTIVVKWSDNDVPDPEDIEVWAAYGRLEESKDYTYQNGVINITRPISSSMTYVVMVKVCGSDIVVERRVALSSTQPSAASVSKGGKKPEQVRQQVRQPGSQQEKKEGKGTRTSEF